MSSLPDRENKGGRASLLRRMLTRARQLCEDERFVEDINRTRLQWNSLYPEYRVRLVSEFGDLANDQSIHRNWYGADWPDLPFRPWRMWPKRLVDDHNQHTNIPRTLRAGDANKRWDEEVNRICATYFPRELFGEAAQDDSDWEWQHPAGLLVGACLFCEPRKVKEHVDLLIVQSRLYPQSLAFQPSDSERMFRAEEQGEVAFWRSFANTILRAHFTDEMVQALLREAGRFGSLYARQANPHPFDVPPEQRWWYLPLTPATTSKDVELAAPFVARTMRQVFGGNRLDQQVIELAAEGLTQKEVAEMLGISDRTVRNILTANQAEEAAEESTD